MSESQSVKDISPLRPVRPDPMLAFFLSALDVRVRAIATEVGEEGKQILDEVQNKLRAFPVADTEHASWNEAYRLERLLALIEPPGGLFLELRRRTREAIDEAIPASARLKESLDTAEKNFLDPSQVGKPRENAASGLRTLLLDALEELHWTAQRKFYARPLQKAAISRTINVGIITFFLFLAPYVYIYAFFTEKQLGQDEFLSSFSWFPLYSSLTAGLFGAFFSRLIFLQSNANSLSLGVLKDSRHWSSILSRGVVGMCGALIVYFFLQSGLLGGSIFPNFNDLGIVMSRWPGAASNYKDNGFHWLLILPDQPLALLVVWSFLAGFSERLVPNVLASTEKTLSDAINKTK